MGGKKFVFAYIWAKPHSPGASMFEISPAARQAIWEKVQDTMAGKLLTKLIMAGSTTSVLRRRLLRPTPPHWQRR